MKIKKFIQLNILPLHLKQPGCWWCAIPAGWDRSSSLNPGKKRLKETWGKLEAGEYDWAHLAYSIWPERVREKCKKDKSMAIAHGLEELYVEPQNPARKRKEKIKEEDFKWGDDEGENL